MSESDSFSDHTVDSDISTDSDVNDPYANHPLLGDPYTDSNTESDDDMEGAPHHYGGPVFRGLHRVEPLPVPLAHYNEERYDIDYILFPVLAHQLESLGSIWESTSMPYTVPPVEAEHHGEHRCLIMCSPWRVFIPGFVSCELRFSLIISKTCPPISI